jgi:hypothetical protein
MPYHQGLLSQRRQSDDLGGLLDPNIVKRGILLPLGRTKQGEMEFAVPEILLSLARSARLPGRVAQGYPFKPEDVTEMAMNVAGTGYLGGAMLVPRGSLAMGGARPKPVAPTTGIKILEDGQPKIFNNPNVRGRADDIAGALQAEFPGLRVEVNQGGSAAGKSAYIKLRYKPEGAKRVIDTEFRISDHSVGARRMQDYPVNENIGLGGETTTDLSDVFSKLKGAIARVDDTIK